MENLKHHLENLETDELIHKLKNNYFQSEASNLAKKILKDRGVEIPDIGESLNEYATYHGETEEEAQRRRHRQYSFIYSFVAPILIAGLVWLILIAILELKLNVWISTALYIGDFFILTFLLSKIQKYICKYDNDDFIVYPSIILLGPTVLYLLLQIFFPLFN